MSDNLESLIQKQKEYITAPLFMIEQCLPKATEQSILIGVMIDELRSALNSLEVTLPNFQVLKSNIPWILAFSEKITRYRGQAQRDVANDSTKIDGQFSRTYMPHFVNEIRALQALPNKLTLHKINEKKILKEKEMPIKEQTIFISHSHADTDYARLVIAMLEAMGIHSNNIRCTSVVGYDIPKGNWKTVIKEYLQNNGHGIFLLSNNFKKSEVSVCELGAIWILGQTFTPILLPNFDIADRPEMIRDEIALNISEPHSWSKIRDSIGDKNIRNDLWESKRDDILKGLELINTATQVQDKSTEPFASILINTEPQKSLDDRIIEFLYGHPISIGMETKYVCPHTEILKQKFDTGAKVNQAIEKLKKDNKVLVAFGFVYIR